MSRDYIYKEFLEENKQKKEIPELKVLEVAFLEVLK